MPLRHLRLPVLSVSRSSRYSAHGRQRPPTRRPPLGPERIILFVECLDQWEGQGGSLYHNRKVHVTSLVIHFDRTVVH